jgi:hypothetical protein
MFIRIKWEHSNEIIFAASGQVFAIGRPTNLFVEYIEKKTNMAIIDKQLSTIGLHREGRQSNFSYMQLTPFFRSEISEENHLERQQQVDCDQARKQIDLYIRCLLTSETPDYELV